MPRPVAAELLIWQVRQARIQSYFPEIEKAALCALSIAAVPACGHVDSAARSHQQQRSNQISKLPKIVFGMAVALSIGVWEAGQR